MCSPPGNENLLFKKMEYLQTLHPSSLQEALSLIDSKYEIPEDVNENVLRTLRKDTEMQTFKQVFEQALSFLINQIKRNWVNFTRSVEKLDNILGFRKTKDDYLSLQCSFVRKSAQKWKHPSQRKKNKFILLLLWGKGEFFSRKFE